MALYFDKRLNLAGKHNNHKYICTWHMTPQIYTVNTTRSKGRDSLQYNNSGLLQHPTLINGHIIQTKNQ